MQIAPLRLDSDAVVLTAFEAAERALELMPTDSGTFRQVDDATLVDLVRRAGRLRDRGKINHWEIHHKGPEYWLIPPPDIDPDQTPIPMPTHNAAMRDLQREREHEHESAVVA